MASGVTFVVQIIYFQTFEAGSMWCWAAISLFLSYWFQPYLWPCPEPLVDEDKQAFSYIFASISKWQLNQWYIKKEYLRFLT